MEHTIDEVAVSEIHRRTSKRLLEVIRVTRLFGWSKRQFMHGKISLVQMCRFNIKAMDKYGIGEQRKRGGRHVKI
jgi:hypothetical protein